MSDTERVAHLQMIQTTIGRLSSNSFAVKSLAATVAAATLALASSVPKNHGLMLCASIFLFVVFWALDARFLVSERAYRNLYERARAGKTESFAMDFEQHKDSRAKFIHVILSWSLSWFYGSLIFLVLVALFILESGGGLL